MLLVRRWEGEGKGTAEQANTNNIHALPGEEEEEEEEERHAL